MDEVNITISCSLETLRALYWLISNTKYILRLAKTDSRAVDYPFYGFLGSQERNLKFLDDLYNKIEPIVEK